MGEVIAMCWKDVLKKDGCGCMTQKSESRESRFGGRGMTDEGRRGQVEEDELSKEGSKKVKPDYIDLDGDGNRKESMKQAAKDKKAKKRSAFTASD